VTAERDPFEVALAALRRKERSSAELARWLERRGYGSADVATAIARLTEAGELDDERFALRYAEDKRELSGWGGERIRQALLARGVESSLVEAVLASDSPGDELERASELLVRRARPLIEDADRQRALEYLARRGYDYEIAYQAVREAASPRAA
jgi:regulatory protein